VKQYPRNWAPPGAHQVQNKNSQKENRKDDKGDKRDDRGENDKR
jgi:hypothetical protein